MKQEYSVYTFGNKKPKKITTSLVEVKIKTQKGDDVLIKANIVPQITGLVQRVPINIPEQQSLKKISRSWHFVSTSATSALGLLIGNYYYHELIFGERIQVQAGLYLIKPKLSWILSGRLSCRNSETVMENVMFIVTQISAVLPLEVHHLAHESTADIFLWAKHRRFVELGQTGKLYYFIVTHLTHSLKYKISTGYQKEEQEFRKYWRNA